MRLWILMGVLSAASGWSARLMAQSALDLTTPPTTAEYEEMIISPEEPDQLLLLPADQKASSSTTKRPSTRTTSRQDAWNSFRMEPSEAPTDAPTTR